MAKRKGGFADAIWGLPWILKVIIAIFFEFVYGICRLVDGLLEHNLLKAVLGFFWIFYGLGIGWIIDIVCALINRRPPLF